MKIWFISDTHTRHRELTVPDADVVVHCGDEANVRQPSLNQIEATDFFSWYSELEIETKIFVPGNHSTAVAEGLITPTDYPSIRFLVHESATLAGLHIFGTPFTPAFFDWAYMKPRAEMDIVWDSIPSHIDLLISHGPPKGIRDVTRHWRTKAPIHVGSKSLMRQVTERIQLSTSNRESTFSAIFTTNRELLILVPRCTGRLSSSIAPASTCMGVWSIKEWSSILRHEENSIRPICQECSSHFASSTGHLFRTYAIRRSRQVCS